jgi:hypothetical protein
MRIKSVLPETVFHNELIEFVLPGKLKQVLPRLLSKTDVDAVCIEPKLNNPLLVIQLDVT